MRKTVNMILGAFLCLLASACRDSHDGPTLSVFQNIVTFTGNGAQTANFEYQEEGDSPLVRLGVKGNLKEDEVKPGTRLLMTYSLPDDVEYGEDCQDVILRGLQTIYNATVTPLPYSDAAACNSPVGLVTIYRTGVFINFTALMPQLPGRRYILAADIASLDTPEAHLYLSTEVEKDEPAYNSTQIGSIDISSVWDRPGITSVCVHVNNPRNPNMTEFVFFK